MILRQMVGTHDPDDAPTVQQQAQRLVASIELSPIATVLTNPRVPDNPIIGVNRAFRTLTGYPMEQILGRNCRFLAGADTDRGTQTLLRHAVAEGRPAMAELINYKRDGTPFLNAVMIAPIVGADGGIAFFLGSQMDAGEDARMAVARRHRATAAIRGLTPRQRQVLEKMIAGYRNKQIAMLLGIDEKTVKMHRSALLDRLGTGSSAEAVRIGVEASLGL